MAEFKGNPIYKGYARGELLYTSQPVSFLGGIDPETGDIIDKKHELYGKNVAGKIFVFPHGKGSTVGSYVIYNLKLKNKAPLAIINEKMEPIVVAGVIMARIPAIDGINISFLRQASIVEVDGNTGIVRILG